MAIWGGGDRGTILGGYVEFLFWEFTGAFMPLFLVRCRVKELVEVGWGTIRTEGVSIRVSVSGLEEAKCTVTNARATEARVGGRDVALTLYFATSTIIFRSDFNFFGSGVDPEDPRGGRGVVKVEVIVVVLANFVPDVVREAARNADRAAPFVVGYDFDFYMDAYGNSAKDSYVDREFLTSVRVSTTRVNPVRVAGTVADKECARVVSVGMLKGYFDMLD